jgi:dihydroorotase
MEDIVKKMSLTPAEILKKVNFGRLKTGEQANFILVDVEKDWVFEEDNVQSRSLNSCFYGRKLKGKVLHTFVKGYQYVL